MRLRISVLLAVLLVAALAVACGDDDGEESTPTPAGTATSEPTATATPLSTEPINILGVWSLAGPYAPFGEITKAVAEIVVDEWNASGGILGRTVDLTIENDQGDFEQGVTLIQQHLEGGDVDWVLPLFNDIAAGPFIKDANVMESSWNSNSILADVDSYPTYFNTPNLNNTGAHAMLEYITETLGAKRIAGLFAIDFVSESFWAEFETVAADFDVEIVGVESFAADQLDTSPQLIKLRDTNPDVLVLSSLAPHVGQALKDRVKIGWDIPVIGDNGAAATDLTFTLGEESATALAGVSLLAYSAGALTPAGEVPAHLEDLVEKVEAKLGGPALFPFYDYAMVHDMMQLIKVGFEGAGTTDADAVTEYLENMDSDPPNPYPFLLQTMNFTPSRHFPDNEDAFVIVKAGALQGGFYTWEADIP